VFSKVRSHCLVLKLFIMDNLDKMQDYIQYQKVYLSQLGQLIRPPSFMSYTMSDHGRHCCQTVVKATHLIGKI